MYICFADSLNGSTRVWWGVCFNSRVERINRKAIFLLVWDAQRRISGWAQGIRQGNLISGSRVQLHVSKSVGMGHDDVGTRGRIHDVNLRGMNVVWMIALGMSRIIVRSWWREAACRKGLGVEDVGVVRIVGDRRRGKRQGWCSVVRLIGGTTIVMRGDVGEWRIW